MGEWAVRECRADTLIYDTVMHNRHCLMGALLSLRASFTIPFDIWRAMCSFSREAVSPDALLPSVPGILTSKISFLKETKRMKVNAQAFQNQFLVFFWRIMEGWKMWSFALQQQQNTLSLFPRSRSVVIGWQGLEWLCMKNDGRISGCLSKIGGCCCYSNVYVLCISLTISSER